MNAAPSTSAIVVTGAAGGIGSAVVDEVLARADEHAHARVYALDTAWTPADLAEDVADVRHRLDVTDAAALRAFFAELAAVHRVRAVVHAAGVLVTGPALDLADEELDRLVDVNLRGTIAVCTAAARSMRGQSPTAPVDATGHPLADRSIVTIASNAGTIPRAGFAAYGATKAAAAHFTRSLGLELAAAGIRCNAVHPGTTRTDMVAAMWNGQDRAAEAVAGDPALFRTGIPLGRIAEPADIAAVVAFLLTDRARHLTLGDVTVDGGATAR